MRKLFFILLILYTTIANSEPSKTFNYLMNEPLTLFEWGIVKLEKHIETFKLETIDTINPNYNYINYDWNTNRLQIEVTVYPRYNTLKKNPAKDLCKLMITILRSRFATHYSEETRSVMGISSFFRHKNFESSSRPSNYMAEIESATELTVEINGSKTNEAPYSTILSCEAPLMGKKISFIDGN